MTTATMSDRTKDTAAAGYESELRARGEALRANDERACGRTGCHPGDTCHCLHQGAGGGPSGCGTRHWRRWVRPPVKDSSTAKREVVSGESSSIRERARTLGMSMKDLAERAGVTPGYMSEVSRGRRRMGVKVQARVEAILEAQAAVAPAKRACADQQALWSRMDAHGISQNEVARRAGISSAHLSNIMGGKASPSAGVLKKLHGVLFRPTKEERVVPAEVKVLAWRKGERHGVVVRGAGGGAGQDQGGAIRVGGRVPWGAKAEFAYRAGYDGAGRVSVTHVVERGYSAMLKQPEMAAA